MRRRYLVVHMSDAGASAWDPDVDGALMDEWLARRAGSEGWAANGERVAGRDEARSIVVRDGSAVVGDGPFPEFKEWFLGVEWIEAQDLDEAVRMLERHPTARIGRIYVIPALDQEREGEKRA